MRYRITDNEPVKLGETDQVKEIIRNIRCILRTRKGSVPMYREFGLSTESLDLPAPAARQRLVADIREAVLLFEPRATVTGVTFRGSGAEGKLLPVVEVEIHGE